MEGIFDVQAKPLKNEKALKHLVAWKLGSHGEGAKVKGETRTPKLAVHRGHPWVVSEFGEKQAIPFNARCMSDI